MLTLEQVRKTIPELDGLNDQDAVDVLHSVYYPDLNRDQVAGALGVKPAAPPPSDKSQFASGFKRSFAELPGLAAGVGAYGADVVGADETRDKLLAYAKDSNDQVAKDHADDAASITDAWDGKSSWTDFLKNSAGYVAGQALQSIATGGLGGVGMRMLVKSGAAKVAEETAARAIATGATEEQAKALAAKAVAEQLQKAGVRGAAAGAGAHNFGMELGSIYPDAADQAQKEGRQLDGEDLARVGLSAGAAAAVDTAGEALIANKLLKGSGVSGGLLKRAAVEVPLGAAREAGTEAVQTGIEHYGAGQPIADDAGLKDIIDSAGVGAVGGGLGGGAGSLHAHAPAQTPGDLIRAQEVPDAGPLSRATNIGLVAGAAHADADMATARAAAAARPAPVMPTPEQAQVLLDMANQRSAELVQKAKGQKEATETDASGNAVTLPAVLPQFLTPAEKQEQEFLKANGGDASALAQAYGLPPAAATTPPNAPAEAALAGRAPAPAPAPQEFTLPVDQARAAIGAKVSGDEGLARMERLVTQTEGAERGQRMAANHAEAATRPPSVAGEAVMSEPGLPEPSMQPRAFEQGPHPADTFEALQEANQRDDQLRKLYAPILNPKGEPFKTEMAAKLAAKKHGGDVQPVDGGFVVQPARPEPAAAPAPAPAPEAAKPEWEHFAPETGTLGAPRADMPQIKTTHRGPLVNFLEARGIAAEPEVVDPKSLKPTQAEFSPQKVADAVERGDDRSILISSDDHILDGHHQWMGKLASDEPIKAIRLDAPIEQLVDEVKQFPSATTAEGATKETSNAAGPAERAVEAETPAAEGQQASAGAGSAGGDREEPSAGAGSAVVEADGLKAEPKIVEHTTAKGKTLRGVVRTDLSHDEAKPASELEKLRERLARETPGTPIHRDIKADIAKLEGAAPAPKAAPKKAKPDERLAKLADYFAPGNIVKSYGGHDRVVSFTPETDRGGWGVKVHAVEKVDGKWIDKAKEDDRNHSTEPDARTLAAGPVERAEAAPAAAAAPATEKIGTLTDQLHAAIARGDMPKDNPALRKLVEAFDGEDATPARMKEAQEALETAIVRTARDVVAKKEGDRSTFDILKRLYESQPNLNVRTSTSIENQAYSTPAPLAFLADRLAGITTTTTVFEPTAGNGMLVIAAKPSLAIVNELNDDRVQSLKDQGFKPTQRDATEGFPNLDGKVDRVIANPPFGPIKNAAGESIKVKVDGYTLGQIDHLISARALAAMKDDGKATLIIGANKSETGRSNNDLVFFNWLYSHYTVTSHFEVDGDLYQRQGAGWPVRVITIDGRKASDAHAPAIDTISRAKTWSEVYERFQQGMGAQRPAAAGGDGAVRGGSRQAADAVPVSRPADAEARPADRGQPEGGAQRPADVAGGSAKPVGDRGAVPGAGVGERAGAVGSNDQAPGPVEDGRPARSPAAAKPARDPGTRGVAAASADPDNQFQTAYRARSTRKDEGVLIPVNMAGPTQDALNRLEDAVGDIDEFARKELGYDSVEALHQALMGLQVDSVASAIQQMKSGKGVIVADQTGIGKGRQAASIIRWAIKNGKTPVFVTVKPSLFTDMFGDLHDIGSDDVAPFILNSSESIKGAGDEKLFANRPALHKGVMERIAASERLPDGRNALFMTYSQINVENTQRKVVMALAPNAVFILDESHNAGGESNTGEFIKGALDLAQGVTYLSATYAKRPDNMPVYFKTDIGEAVADDDTLMAAMDAGGLPLQTVVANNLVKAGQMFRRERSYDGVSIVSRADTAHKAEHVRLSDETTQSLRAIVAADRMFHEVFVKEMKKALEEQGARLLDDAGNQVKESVDHTQFSSVVHNFVRQMLLGLKAQEAADDAVRSIKAGEKPLIAVENTMGSFLNEYAENNGLKVGDALGAFDYRTVLSRALERSRYITKVLPNGDKVKEYIPLARLDPVTRQAYDNAQDIIDSLKIDIPVSPIDWIRNELAKAGHSVREITGRNLAVDYSDPKNPKLSQIEALEQKDKVRTTRGFNNGSLDALILNVAGSTGISLHASERFKDQRVRHMIVAQAAQDINIFMQMLGRIHRTGQVALPKYTILSADLPAEIRPTALLSAKMKSLNANTSSNTESATSVKAADMLNKYGDFIVNQYLSDNPQLAEALGIIHGSTEAEVDDIARKATGRLALMPVATQAQFYAEVEEQYQSLIDYLNKTNQNDLEPRTFDFDARETKSATLFEGQNPASPFGEDAVYNEYSVKAQGKMMTPAEIKAQIAENLGGIQPPLHQLELTTKLGLAFNQWLPSVPEGLQGAAAGVKTSTLHFMATHRIGSTFRVDINGDTYNAIVTNLRSTHKSAGNPFSLSKVQVTLALNGSLRQVTVPGTQFQGIEVSALHGYERNFDALFQAGPPDERETAKIVTGNLLGAYGELNGTRGSIITFTKADGTTEQGILLPKAFSFAKDVRQDYRLRTAADAYKFLQGSTHENIGKFGINSRDNVVRVMPEARGDGIVIQVPKSKAKGGKYFLDAKLRAVTGDFVSVGNYMRATVEGRAGAEKAIDLLMQKQALYALPSMAEEARSIVGDGPAAKELTPAFSRAQTTDEQRAMKALGDHDELFQLPRSDKKSVEGIAADNDPDIRVQKVTNIPGETRYNFTMPNGDTARMMVRSPNPYGPSPYGFDLKDGEMGEIQTVRPGENPQDVDARKGDVWIDVSMLKSGGFGSRVYNIAATYAHNTDRVFIGDPAGLSDEALIRRPEQMLSSALKFGTTEHLAPHPRQVTGDKALGVPGLKWVYGDDLGNIRRLIDLNLKVQASGLDVRFDPTTGTFLDSDGQPLDRASIDALAVAADPRGGTRAGGATVARAAVWRALLREEGRSGEGKVGGRNGVLAKLAELASNSAPDIGGIFYSHGRAAEDGRPARAVAARTSAVEAFANQVASRWANAPSIVVVDDMADPKIPEAVRAEDSKQRSQGASGDPEGFYLNGTVYLVSSQLPGDRDVLRVLMHESLGHFGLRSVFGKELATILDRMAVLQHAKVLTKAREYGLDMDKLTDRRAAAEEVLAELAQTSPELGWVQRAVAAIRTWLRDNVPGFDKMKFTDAEIVRNFIEPARDWVKRGSGPTDGGPRGGLTPAMFSRSLGPALTNPTRSIRDINLPAGYKVGDLLNDAGKLSWWHSTVGTPFNLAQKSVPFRRVYDSVQTFLNDVSFYASEAADKAPRILPRLSGIKDMGKAALSAEDTRAISAPIFEGTLSWARDENGKPVLQSDRVAKADKMSADEKAHALLRAGEIDPNVLRMWQGRELDEYEQMIGTRYEQKLLQPGIVWSPAELAARYKLSPHQVSLYTEFRKSVDASLNNLGISDMLRFGGKDVADVRDRVTNMDDASQAAEVLRDHLFDKAAEFPERADVLNDTANKMIDKGDRVRDLIARGYAPLSRFGQYTLDVVKPDGERAYFGLFESPAERSKMARSMETQFPGAEIRQGTTSQEEYKMFAGVSPETLALFGDMLGLEEQGGGESSKVFQQYIKLAKNSRSAMKRLIERKGIAGFSEDAGRVLAGFVYSNARQTASNLHMGEIGEATQAIPQGQGQLKDAAVKLVDYVKNPQEEAQGLRGLLFAQYLGGSVASAMVNATQPLAVTFPYLSQYLGVAGSARQMTAAVRDAIKKTTGDAALDAALHKAEEDGIVSPQEVHSLQAQAAGRAQLKGGDGTTLGDAAAKASNAAAKLRLLWGHVFSIPEQFNRRVTFIAAYRTAVEKNIENPAKFAAKAVAETQFTYNKGNKPAWARGAFGATLFTFKQYTVSYLELLHRMYTSGPEGKKAALLAIAVLFMMSGTDGLPGADDLDDLIDGFMQRLGYNWNTKMEKRRFLANILGDGAAQFLAKGITGLPGAPIDVAGRMGMGNLIPGTGLLTKKPDHTSDILELAGPAGDLVKRAFGSANALAEGDLKGASTGILPTAASNWAKAYDMASTGAYHDQRGYKVLDVDGYDALAKAVGFQPHDVSKVQEATGEATRYKSLAAMRTQEITAKWANGLATGDQAMVQQAKDERDNWNAKNPDAHMKINMPSVLKRVQEIRQSKEQRIEKSTPAGIRAKVRADLREQTE